VISRGGVTPAGESAAAHGRDGVDAGAGGTLLKPAATLESIATRTTLLICSDEGTRSSRT
jgi:hypothetical protein